MRRRMGFLFVCIVIQFALLISVLHVEYSLAGSVLVSPINLCSSSATLYSALSIVEQRVDFVMKLIYIRFVGLLFSVQ